MHQVSNFCLDDYENVFVSLEIPCTPSTDGMISLSVSSIEKILLQIESLPTSTNEDSLWELWNGLSTSEKESLRPRLPKLTSALKW